MLKYLRVLCLSHYSLTELPDSIGDLRHLRYLDVSFTGIRELPNSTNALYNLQTLTLFHCHSLVKLPENIGTWTNLRHFDVTGSALRRMPMQLTRLKNLQKMPTFIVGKNAGSSIRELTELSLLQGSLSVVGLENVVHVRDAMDANLKSKKFVDDLVLEWSSKPDNSRNETIETAVLDKLHPHEHLKRLAIRNCACLRLPKWLGDSLFVHMVFLSLSHLENCTSLPPLGNLPSLKNLCIVGMAGIKTIGPEFYGNVMEPFQSLETLSFENMLEWEEWSSLRNGEGGGFPCLQELYLQRCPKLRQELPNDCQSLTRLVILDCTELAPSFSVLATLQKLELRGCNKELLSSVNTFTSLVALHISKVSDLSCLPEGFFQHLRSVEDLALVDCGDIASLSNQTGFQNLTSLQKLQICGCPVIENLPYELCNMSCLTSLEIEGCPSLLSFPEMGLPTMLTHLTIEECQALVNLPGRMLHESAHLQYLCISGCSSLESFIGGGDLPATNLKSLIINECEKLKSLPEGLHHLTALQELRISDCPCLVAFPVGGLPLNLASLWIESCENLQSLPNQIQHVSSLQELYIKSCPAIMALPQGSLPTKLESLRISSCENLVHCIGLELHRLTSLRNFSIRGCGGLLSFPGDWLLPTTLTSLCIIELPDLRSMSEGVLLLTSLEKLEIRECHKLLSLPENGLPDSLSFLEIWKCPTLSKRLLKEKEDWPKIAHIPCIKNDYMLIL